MQTIGKFLNEQSLGLLESHWADLPHHAYSEPSNSGWQIHLKGGSSVFKKAGFRAVDRVGNGDLLRFAGTTDQRNLLERFLAILEHIRRA